MNNKALFAGVILLAVAMGISILHNRRASRTLPDSRQLAQTNKDAAAAEPKQEAQALEVKLTGITTILGRKQALLRLEQSSGGESCILSEGQSKDGLTVESIDAANATVILRVAQVKRTLRLERGPRT